MPCNKKLDAAWDPGVDISLWSLYLYFSELPFPLSVGFILKGTVRWLQLFMHCTWTRHSPAEEGPSLPVFFFGVWKPFF